jgi:ubiquinone biosynthesis protein UbiJ
MALPLPVHAVPALINHLLAQEPAARAKLARNAGSVARIEAGFATFNWKVLPDGLLAAADAGDPVRVTIRVNPADLPLILQNRERAFSYVKVEGDAEFANAISQLSQSLRWEAEHDLSRWIGDVAAVRVAGAVRALFDAGRDTGRRFAENTAEYFLEEDPLLLRPPVIAAHGERIATLRDDVERMEKRIARLEARLLDRAKRNAP